MFSNGNKFCAMLKTLVFQVYLKNRFVVSEISWRIWSVSLSLESARTVQIYTTKQIGERNFTHIFSRRNKQASLLYWVFRRPPLEILVWDYTPKITLMTRVKNKPCIYLATGNSVQNYLENLTKNIFLSQSIKLRFSEV